VLNTCSSVYFQYVPQLATVSAPHYSLFNLHAMLCMQTRYLCVLQVLLRQHGVVLLHHVKPRLMERIARLTGAQILPSIDSVMNRYTSHFESHNASVFLC
jgi:hypothetical protein